MNHHTTKSPTQRGRAREPKETRSLSPSAYDNDNNTSNATGNDNTNNQ